SEMPRLADDVLVDAKAGGECPFHRLFGMNIDILVDDEDMLDERQLQQRRDDAAAVAGGALLDRDPDMVQPGCRRREVNCADIEAGHFEGPPGQRLEIEAAQLRRVVTAQMTPAMEEGLVKHVLAHGDCGDVKDRVGMHRAVKTIELAIRSFGLGIAALVEVAIDRQLTIGRVSPRIVAISWNSSIGAFEVAARKSQGCEPMTKLTGRRSLRSTAAR